MFTRIHNQFPLLIMVRRSSWKFKKTHCLNSLFINAYACCQIERNLSKEIFHFTISLGLLLLGTTLARICPGKVSRFQISQVLPLPRDNLFRAWRRNSSFFFFFLEIFMLRFSFLTTKSAFSFHHVFSPSNVISTLLHSTQRRSSFQSQAFWIVFHKRYFRLRGIFCIHFLCFEWLSSVLLWIIIGIVGVRAKRLIRPELIPVSHG